MRIDIEPNPRQEARKAKTRGRILDAARTLFARVGYNSTTIDHITHHAGVGRGTFYMHFDGKAELLQAMFLDFRDRLIPILQSLGDHVEVDGGTIPTWIENYIAFLESQAPSIRAMWAAVHVGAGGFLEREQWHAMALDAFGKRIPAFRIAAEQGDPTVTARAQLILFQLEGFATACALEGWDLGVEATISEIAEAIWAFITQTADPTRQPRVDIPAAEHA